jgi:hypothetical protein
MRGALIATILAAAIAGVFTLLTELIAVNKGRAPASPQSDTLNPLTKGDRLDLRPVKDCLFVRKQQSYESDCIRFAEAE